jgi:undecaprenyl-diphosphatase
VSLSEAIVLGIVQGLTEFLPVSSSGHLVVVPALLGWEQPGLAFAVAVHVGSAVAVVAYYRRDWYGILTDTFRWVLSRRVRPAPGKAMVLPLLLVATVPAAVVGLTLAEPVEKMFNNVALVGGAFIVTGLILLIAHFVARGEGAGDKVSVTQALLIGCAQAVAVIPGISRSGATISAGLLAGLSKDWAPRFAFLLSTPVILGAGLKEGMDVWAAKVPVGECAVLGCGAVLSAITGIIAIHTVVRILHGRRLWWFAVYCLMAGVFTLGACAARSLS